MPPDFSSDAVTQTKTTSSHLLVIAQLFAIAACCWPVGGLNAGPWLALLISGAGIALGVYTLIHNRPGNFDIYPEPKRDSRLVTTGPYRWVRHPMYASLLVSMLGITLFNGHALNVVGLAALIGVVFGKIVKEERYLRQRHPEYAAYEQRTKRLIPFLV